MNYFGSNYAIFGICLFGMSGWIILDQLCMFIDSFVFVVNSISIYACLLFVSQFFCLKLCMFIICKKGHQRCPYECCVTITKQAYNLTSSLS